MRFRALLSWLWPMPVDRFTTLHGPMEVRYEGGALVLNSERGNQSFGSLHRVWQDVFQRIGLKNSPPTSVLLLGLGGGSVVREQVRDEWVKIEDKLVPTKISMLDVKTGDVSVISMADLNVNQGVGDDLFSRRNLLRE